MTFTRVLLVIAYIASTSAASPASISCRDRSNSMRQDGGLCFELPPWQYQPVQLEEHVTRLRSQWLLDNTTDTRRQNREQKTENRGGPLSLANTEISRYMDTVLAPFLDMYHRNIQNSYQQLTAKMLRSIKEEINGAVRRKEKIYTDLTKLAEQLDVPVLCDAERRQARSLASNYVSQIYACTEGARASIARLGKYAEEMISMTKDHMQETLGNVSRSLDLNGQRNKALKKTAVTTCLEDLSRAAVSLGYELDLSLSNARRHNEQSCERLDGCSGKAKKKSEENVAALRDQIYQCVYA